MEPMDQDNNLCYRSSSPPVSPGVGSDMEVDPNSPQPPLSYHHQRPTTPSVVGSPSLDSMNQSLNDILSLKNTLDSDPRSIGNNKVYKTPVRPCQSAPPIASPFCQQNTELFNHNVGKASQPRGSERAATSLGERTSCFTPKLKPGYGLDVNDDDDDTVFSHYPLSISKEQNLKSALRSRTALKPTTSKSEMPCKSLNKHFDDISQSKAKKEDQSATTTTRRLFVKISCSFILVSLMFALLLIPLLQESCVNSQMFQSKLLEVNLKTDLFGQHIASKLIQKHVNQYFDIFYSELNSSNSLDMTTNVEERENCRPLVLSFHGWTGVGKNFGSQIMSQAFTQVSVHPFIIPLLFPHISHQELYATQIQDWIVSSITKCSVNLFIVDEVDKAFPLVQKAIVKVINSLTSVNCLDSTPIIFILISNTHAATINQIFVSQHNLPSVSTRNDFTESHFHSVFNSSKNEWYSDLASAGMIDAFVPFMPLEKIHVIECIKRELITNHLSTDSDIVSQVLKELSFTVYGNLELSSTGCKRVADKVNYVIYNDGK